MDDLIKLVPLYHDEDEDEDEDEDDEQLGVRLVFLSLDLK